MKSSTFSSLRRPPSPAMMMSRMYLTRVRQPSSSKRGGRHAGLERVAGLEAGREERILMAEVVVLGLGQELPALIGVQIAPAHHRLLQRKVERRLLIGGQLHAGAGIALVADGGDLHRVGGGRQVADVIAALLVRQNVHGHLVLHVLGHHERAHEGLAVGSRHVAGDRRPEGARRQASRQRQGNQNPLCKKLIRPKT